MELVEEDLSFEPKSFAHVTLAKSFLELILSEFHKEKLIGKIGTYFKNSYPEVFIVENSLLILTPGFFFLFVENSSKFFSTVFHD